MQGPDLFLQYRSVLFFVQFPDKILVVVFGMNRREEVNKEGRKQKRRCKAPNHSHHSTGYVQIQVITGTSEDFPRGAQCMEKNFVNSGELKKRAGYSTI